MDKGKPIREIGDKVTARYKTFLTDTNSLHRAWIPMIQADGELLAIFDESTVSGQMEAETLGQALKMARTVRNELIAKLAESGGSETSDPVSQEKG